MKKKICLYLGSMSLGGIGKLNLHLMEEFIRRGIDVDLFLMKGGGEYMGQIPKEVRVFVEGGSYYRRVRKFIGYLNKERPDVSISARQRQDFGNIIGCLLSRSKTRPVISVHTNLSVENRQRNIKDNPFFKVLAKSLYKIPEKFIAVSEGVADDFAGRTGVKRNKIKVIYNPVYKPYNIKSEELQRVPPEFRKLAQKGKKFIVGVGRLTQQKDFATLIRAFSLMKQAVDVSLVILGEGPLREDLEKLIDELQLGQDICLLGFVDNPQYYIRRAGAFILSSKWEGFGNVIVEAMGVGTPVISTDCPSGPSEILEGGKYGKLVPVEDPQKMAAAIIETLNTPHCSDTLIERAKYFSTKTISEKYLQYIFD